MPERVLDPTRCSICGCRLDQPDDPLSVDCGDNCYGCMISVKPAKPAEPVCAARSDLRDIEDKRDPPELPPDQFALWLELQRATVAALFASLEGPRRTPGERIAEQERVVRAWMARFQALGLDERAAGLLVRGTVASVMCPVSPDS